MSPEIFILGDLKLNALCASMIFGIFDWFDTFSYTYLNLENYAKSSFLLVIRCIHFRKNLEQPTSYTVIVDIRHCEVSYE
jgi:hypothetical protein